mmetsp:Transcript_26888/g.59018  ORF Transcript_26888/g.59018 Transcript_26888/m.59018 type:complete len:204 (-) Transcript_26888:1594-2205(-)|eukprot:CAMPEP_0168193736 /NCGR_PEP_ID=MMETSP0139_2-20121125/18775_1 /TAXON_ID=44445 /ORGANISM="Pseudo-nitzschia australis, Strain 10249 10 AB" /LENGTH=203 /DNA_ID=CAMNT_0008117131 /DNA_START=154 /DNA_END=765 /DNA_ORIENTATION=+
MNSFICAFLLCLLLSFGSYGVDGFSIVLMGRRGKGDLKRALSGNDGQSKKRGKNQDPTAAMNEGKGQEITGVTLPAEGMLKGWQFGDDKVIACANSGGQFFAVQGDCPRCGFDLWKGDLITDDPGFEDLPAVACPTCATTFSLKSGFYGPPLKRTGLAGFVSGLAKTATANQTKNADSFAITVDSDTGRVFCKKMTPKKTVGK